jgi:hypothetical protein
MFELVMDLIELIDHDLYDIVDYHNIIMISYVSCIFHF